MWKRCRYLVIVYSHRPESINNETALKIMNGKNRKEIKPGTRVKVVQKQDQKTGKLTEGVVKNILTNSATHPHGIKVRLESGIVGRVKEIIQ